MPIPSPFASAPQYLPAATLEVSGVTLSARFGDPADEYRTAREGVVLFDRSNRGLVIVTGRDRKAWLHNMLTNVINTLDDNSGNYAFAIDLQGRVQFDLNILNLPDVLWLDIEASFVAPAIAHLDRYLLSEDARMTDAGAQFARLACSGPKARDVAAQLGLTNFPAMAALSSIAIVDDARFVRHDLASDSGFELIVPANAAAEWWRRLVDLGAAPAGQETLDVLRIEAGIPWLGRDIDAQVLPPETGQVERGISYHKGCYLGQEVIERMRSRGSLARRLVRLRCADGAGVTAPTEIHTDGKVVGRVTSFAPHPIAGDWIGLGYLRTTLTDNAVLTCGEDARPIDVVA